MRPGTATSWNSWSVVKWNPTLGSLVAVTLQISQMEKPMFSARMDQTRLRRAIARPPLFQKVSSSGSHFSIHVDSRAISISSSPALLQEAGQGQKPRFQCGSGSNLSFHVDVVIAKHGAAQVRRSH